MTEHKPRNGQTTKKTAGGGGKTGSKSSSSSKTAVSAAGRSSAGGRGKPTGRSASASSSAKTAPKTAPKKETAPKPPLHLQIVPAVLILFAVLILIFLVCESDRGTLGGYIARALAWLFGMARWFVPFFLVMTALFWKRDWENGRNGVKIAVTAIVCLTVCSLFYYFPAVLDHTILTPSQIWEGAENGSLGGGVLGNALGSLLLKGVGSVASPVILFLLLIFFSSFLFGLTPMDVYQWIREKIQENRLLREERRLLREEEGLAEDDDDLSAARPIKKTASRESSGKQQAPKEQGRTSAVKAKFNTDVELGEETVPQPLRDEPFAEEDFREPEASPQPIQTQAEPLIAEESFGEDSFSGTPLSEDVLPFDLDEFLSQTLPPDAPAAEQEPLRGDAASYETVQTAQEETETLENAEEDLNVAEDEVAATPVYRFPPITLLSVDRNRKNTDVSEELTVNARKLVETLHSFKVSTRVDGISRGPTITRYELMPEKGVRVRAIANLVDDIALNLAAEGVRIEAPIPGKAAVGVEVPNKVRETVYLRSLFDDSRFKDAGSVLTAALGVGVGGEPTYVDLAKMPHLLIAGTTGSGKSVCMNCLILSLLYKYHPDDVKMIMIDPKKVEFNIYNGLPHLMIPVVSQAKKAAGALSWAVTEMERRYELIENVGVRDIRSYNSLTKDDPDREYMPFLVIFIDELADLMMTAPSEVEESICRIAQKGRAAGLHLIIGTQRPSVDVITGLIKANVPSRIAFTVSSQVDSRTILDIGGAEKLIGRGDMLFAPIGATKPIRLQGAFVSDGEVEAVTTFIKDNAGGVVNYDDKVMRDIEKEAELCGVKGGKKTVAPAFEGGDGDEEADPMLTAAIDLAVESGKISTSLIQRRLSLGYGRAAKLIDRMQEMGVVSPPEGQKPRTVLLSPQQWAERKMRSEEHS